MNTLENSIASVLSLVREFFASVSRNDISMLVKLSICLILFVVLIIICGSLIKIKHTNENKKINTRNAHKRRRSLEFIFWITALIFFYYLLRWPFEVKKRHEVFLNGNLHPSLIYCCQAIFVLLSAFAFYLGQMFLKYYKTIADTPTANIRSAIQGYTELEGIGKVDANNVLLGPLTKRPCLWYKYSISKKIRRKNSNSWQVIEQGESIAMVRLQDNTGECLIDIEKAEINFSMPAKVWFGNTLHPDDLPIKEEGIVGWLLKDEYKYEEEILLPDEKIYTIGMFRTINGQSLLNKNKDIELHKLLRQWKTDYQALLDKYDINKDGNLSAEEWNKVVKSAEEEIYLKYPELKPLSSPDAHAVNILSNLALPDGKLFLISDKSQAVLINTYKSKAMAYPFLFILFLMLAYHFKVAYDWYLSFFSI